MIAQLEIGPVEKDPIFSCEQMFVGLIWIRV